MVLMTKEVGTAKPAVLLAAAMALSGTVGIFAIQANQPTLNIVFFRCVFGALSLMGWCLYRGKLGGIFSIGRKQTALILVSGLCLVLNWATLFKAFGLISIGFAFIIYHLQPFWIVLAGAAFLGESLSRDKLLWLGIAFSGLVLVVWPRVGDIMVNPDWAAGFGFAVLASIFYAGATLTARRVKNVDPAILTIVHCLVGVVIFAPFLTLTPILDAPPADWSWLVGIGVIHTGIVYVILYANYPKLPTPTIGVCAFMNPITALFCDYFFYGRAIGPLQSVGVVLILLAGLAITLGSTLRRSASKRST